MWTLLVFLSCLVALSRGDIGYYENTNAETVTDENLSSRSIPTAVISLRTSNSYLAGTADTVEATFIGDFSTSGPHSLGSFSQGEHSSITIELDRVIGQLQRVLLHKDGSDGYLLSNMQVRMGDKVFEMTGPRQWLDNLDPGVEAAYPDSGGYEPEVQEGTDAVPVQRHCGERG